MFRENGCYFVDGLLSGVTVGAMVVLLFTPLPGCPTCGLLSDKAQSLEHKAEEVAPAMQRAPAICVQGRRKILDGLLLLARGDVEKLGQNFGFGSKWLVIG